MKSCRSASFLFVLAALAGQLSEAPAQTTADYAVQISAMVQTNPAQVSLSWVPDPLAASYTVYRKTRDDASWGTGTTLPGTSNGYLDSSVGTGSAYEYRIDKTPMSGTSGVAGKGYIYAGIQAPLNDFRGKVILLVDDRFAAPLSVELVRLQQDLIGDGWTVLRHDISRTNAVTSVKALIKADYAADPANVKALFLFGHIPVPYSGNFAPDGHSDHVGAWPADVYYGDMDGIWTDSSVNTTSAYDPRNQNVPGDGKFDQSSLPSDVELQVGRVDLSDLPSFSLSEVELLRQYLNKDHNFRMKNIQVDQSAGIIDAFGTLYGEAFAANGFRNFAAFFEPTNIQAVPPWTWQTSLHYLWGYGCGAGSYSSAGGVTTTTVLGTNDPKVVFTMLFGSYFGDWDSTDNFMRASLATPTYTLSSAWVGRPCWQFHHMALGETLGFSTRLSQNNSTLYIAGNSPRGVHVALMGDPTLRMHPVAPPGNLMVLTNVAGGANLYWTPSPDATIGYHVYRAASTVGPFTRLTSTPVNGTNFTDNTSGTGAYMVRAVTLQGSASGTYYNASQGAIQTMSGTAAVLFPPKLNLSVKSPGVYVVTGTGIPGQRYQIQASNGAPPFNWAAIASVTNDAAGSFQVVDHSTSVSRVYRTVSE